MAPVSAQPQSLLLRAQIPADIDIIPEIISTAAIPTITMVTTNGVSGTSVPTE